MSVLETSIITAAAFIAAFAGAFFGQVCVWLGFFKYSLKNGNPFTKGKQ